MANLNVVRISNFATRSGRTGVVVKLSHVTEGAPSPFGGSFGSNYDWYQFAIDGVTEDSVALEAGEVLDIDIDKAELRGETSMSPDGREFYSEWIDNIGAVLNVKPAKPAARAKRK